MSAKWRMLLPNSTHRIHLWDMYPHLVDFHIKCRYHTCIIWAKRCSSFEITTSISIFFRLLSIYIQNTVHDATILTFFTIPCIRLLQLSKAFKHYVASPEMSFRLPSNHLMLNCGDAANKIQMRAAKPTRSRGQAKTLWGRSCARRKPNRQKDPCPLFLSFFIHVSVATLKSWGRTYGPTVTLWNHVKFTTCMWPFRYC